ncbi:MAG: type II toxin-antitoxin system RelE/ParE family toxin [Oscillospiraceae bacterium]|nr:type II toxin-antitoxin system RelE/ParE family toxin [Oscillospiraceae bacterium]
MEQKGRYHVKVSTLASQMLVYHADFLAQVSPRAAERLTQAFEKAANSLEVMPERCPCLSDENTLGDTYRYILFERRYMIVFRIVDDTVYADYVIDCRQDYSWLLQ